MFAFRFLVPIFAFDGSLTTFESADETRMEKGTCTLQYTPLLLRAIVLSEERASIHFGVISDASEVIANWEREN